MYRSKRTGAAVVEFAIVAPLFFLLVFGMIEYGRMVMVQQVITNASREGARRAVLDGATTSDVVATVEEFLAQASVSGDNLVINVNPNPPDSAHNGDPVEVSIEIPFTDVSWMPSPMYLGGTTMEAKTVMRREGVK
ncbi:MAG: TadE/TadG family type IV pilus assembly protein [Blastopirellula sp. JB062]